MIWLNKVVNHADMLMPDETYEDDGITAVTENKFTMRSNNYFVKENEIMQLCEEFLKKYKIRPDFFCKFNPTIKANECNYNNKKPATVEEGSCDINDLKNSAKNNKPSVIYAIPKLGQKFQSGKKGEFEFSILYIITTNLQHLIHCMNERCALYLYVYVSIRPRN